MFVMVSYDVVDDKTRMRLLKFLKNFGNRVQYSVFECELNEEQFEKMKQGVESIINKKEDRVRYYVICKACMKRIVISGWGEVPEDKGFEII